MILLAGSLLAGSSPVAASAQQVTVSGTVVEAARSSWIRGATVQLSGSQPYFTDLDGRFRFSGVTPGRHTLSVQAYGYRPWSTEVVIRSDTTLQVEMEPDPIVLDSIVVEAKDVTIKGKVFDAATGKRILGARVTVYPDGRTKEAHRGDFTIYHVPAGRVTTVVVEAVERLPARIALITESDTTLTVELEVDSVGVRMIAQEDERLEGRAQSVPLAMTAIGPEDLARREMTPIMDMLRSRVSHRYLDRTFHRRLTTPCLFIDDRRASGEEIETLYAGEVNRVEVYGHGEMIRVYTTQYVASMAPLMPKIVYSESGLSTVCY